MAEEGSIDGSTNQFVYLPNNFYLNLSICVSRCAGGVPYPEVQDGDDQGGERQQSGRGGEESRGNSKASQQGTALFFFPFLFYTLLPFVSFLPLKRKPNSLAGCIDTSHFPSSFLLLALPFFFPPP